jgi:hypothetical protein
LYRRAVPSLSTIVSVLIPILYFIKKKCREHPSSIIAIISLLEAITNYNVILIALKIYKFEELISIGKILRYFIWYSWSSPEENTYFCEINFSTYIVFELAAIAYTIAFSADLLVTLKFPFFAGHRRMKFYHIFAFVFVSAASAVSISYTYCKCGIDSEICYQEFRNHPTYKVPQPFIASIMFFYLFSFVIIAMSFQSAQTSEIRQKYIRLHRIILFTLLVIWAFPLASNIMILANKENT